MGLWRKYCCRCCSDGDSPTVDIMMEHVADHGRISKGNVAVHVVLKKEVGRSRNVLIMIESMSDHDNIDVEIDSRATIHFYWVWLYC